MVLENGAEVGRVCVSLESKCAPEWLTLALSVAVADLPAQKHLVPAQPYKRADGSSLSAFPRTRFWTTLCCSASVELMQLQLGTAVPVCLPGWCCPSRATVSVAANMRILGLHSKFLSSSADYRRVEGEPRATK